MLRVAGLFLTPPNNKFQHIPILGINSSSSSSSISCDCESCETTHCTGKAEQAEVDEVRIGWSKVKDGLKRIYVMVIC